MCRCMRAGMCAGMCAVVADQVQSRILGEAIIKEHYVCVYVYRHSKDAY